MQTISEGYKKATKIFTDGIGHLLLLSFVNLLVTFGIAIFAYALTIIGIAVFGVIAGSFESLDSDLAPIIMVLAGIIGFVLMVLFYVAVAVVSVVMQAAIMYAVKDVAEGKKDMNISTHLSRAWEAKWKLLTISLWMLLFVFGGFLLFIIPGIVASILFMFATYAFVYEGVEGRAALTRSSELVRAYFWPLAGRVLLFMFAIMIIGSIGSIIPFANIAIQLFMVVAVICYYYVLYHDMVTGMKKLKENA